MILVVEDCRDVAHLVRTILVHAGHEVVYAGGLGEAVKAIRERVPSVILLDYLLPDGTGEDLLRRMATDPDLAAARGAPVVILSDRSEDPALRERLYTLGVRACLPKPFGGRELVAVVEGVLEQAGEFVVASGVAERAAAEAVETAVAGLAHEVNTPLSCLVSTHRSLRRLADRVGEFEVRADLHRLIERDERALARIARVVEDLMRVGRSGGVPGRRPQVVELEEEIEAAIAIAGHRLEGITVIRDLQGPRGVRAVPGDLCQAFVNILLNAADAVGGEGRVVVRSRPAPGGGVRVEIEDDGRGIPPERLGRVFDPFYTTRPGGLGLGLALAREAVRRSRGEVFVESESARGTTFSMVLPAEAVSRGVA